LSACEISGAADGVLAPARDDADQRRGFEMNRKLFWAVLGIGVALVVTPFDRHRRLRPVRRPDDGLGTQPPPRAPDAGMRNGA
jgi:hypothetical protein